jgi:hypothetical protein
MAYRSLIASSFPPVVRDRSLFATKPLLPVAIVKTYQPAQGYIKAAAQ